MDELFLFLLENNFEKAVVEYHNPSQLVDLYELMMEKEWLNDGNFSTFRDPIISSFFLNDLYPKCVKDKTKIDMNHFIDLFEGNLKSYLCSQLPRNKYITVNEVSRLLQLKFRFSDTSVLTHPNLPLSFILENKNKFIFSTNFDRDAAISMRAFHYSHLKEILSTIPVRPPNSWVSRMKNISKNIILPHTMGGIEMCEAELKNVVWDFKLLSVNPSLNPMFIKWLNKNSSFPSWLNIMAVSEVEQSKYQKHYRYVMEELMSFPLHSGITKKKKGLQQFAGIHFLNDVREQFQSRLALSSTSSSSALSPASLIPLSP